MSLSSAFLSLLCLPSRTNCPLAYLYLPDTTLSVWSPRLLIHSSPPVLAHSTGTFSTAEELLARAEFNGYKVRAYQEKDSTRDYERHIDKAKKDQNAALDHYVL
jgi:hypothetical protein